MKNFRHNGKVITRANTAAVFSGEPIAIGSKAGVPSGDYAANESGEYVMAGVFSLADDGANHVQGVLVDWSIAGKECVATTTGDFPLGYVTKTGAAGVVEVMVNGSNY